MIETKRLAYFVQVAESGSLSKASERLHIAQPALSRQIQILESYLGFSLFTRTGRGMQLTREGQYLRDAVIGPLRDLELAVENLRSFLGRSDFTIGIGIHSGLTPIIAKPLFDALVSTAPKVTFNFREETSTNLLHSLKRGVIDFAVVDCPSNDDNVTARLVATEDLVLVTAQAQIDHSVKKVTFKQLLNYSLVLPPIGSETRDVVDKAFKQINLKPDIFLETDSISLLGELLQAGPVAALMAGSLAEKIFVTADWSITPVADPPLAIGTYLATRSYGEVEGSLISLIETTIEKVVLNMLESR